MALVGPQRHKIKSQYVAYLITLQMWPASYLSLCYSKKSSYREVIVRVYLRCICVWRTGFRREYELVTRQNTQLMNINKNAKPHTFNKSCAYSFILLLIYFFFLWCFDPIPGHGLQLWCFAITHNDTLNRQDSSGRVISPTQRPVPYNTQQLREKNTRAPGGIRTRNPCKRAAAELGLRPRGHWDRPIPFYGIIFNKSHKRINLSHVL